jgi:hypothetical protein
VRHRLLRNPSAIVIDGGEGSPLPGDPGGTWIANGRSGVKRFVLAACGMVLLIGLAAPADAAQRWTTSQVRAAFLPDLQLIYDASTQYAAITDPGYISALQGFATDVKALRTHTTGELATDFQTDYYWTTRTILEIKKSKTATKHAKLFYKYQNVALSDSQRTNQAIDTTYNDLFTAPSEKPVMPRSN